MATGLTDQDRERIEDALERSVSANTPSNVRLCLEILRGLDAGPQSHVPAGTAGADCCLPPGAGRRKRDGNGHHPTVQGRYRRDPPLHRPRGPTLHEGVKRVMGGISRSRGKAQRQAKPVTAEALAAVRATATGHRVLKGAGKRQGVPEQG